VSVAGGRCYTVCRAEGQLVRTQQLTVECVELWPAKRLCLNAILCYIELLLGF
jgi:hypothetical protein